MVLYLLIIITVFKRRILTNRSVQIFNSETSIYVKTEQKTHFSGYQYLPVNNWFEKMYDINILYTRLPITKVTHRLVHSSPAIVFRLETSMHITK